MLPGFAQGERIHRAAQEPGYRTVQQKAEEAAKKAAEAKPEEKKEEAKPEEKKEGEEKKKYKRHNTAAERKRADYLKEKAKKARKNKPVPPRNGPSKA